MRERIRKIQGKIEFPDIINGEIETGRIGQYGRSAPYRRMTENW